MDTLRLTVEGRSFRDSSGREITLRGINVAGDTKFPSTPDLPSHVSDNFFDGDSVSYVDRPFSAKEAPVHFARLRRWGYNTLRYLFTWEAIEHAGPRKYDEEWIEHTIGILRLAKEYGFYVFLDPHQDVWSRFSGGCGAPMWTLYACGLDPRHFEVTEAALVHSQTEDPASFPKMIWSTNYYRLVSQVMFTLFFAGRDFAPKAIIDGKNIQDYLQEHFLGACQHLARRIHEAGELEDQVIIGWENMNESNRGLVGAQDLTVIPSEQKLQKGTSPTAWQAILTGSGRACEIATWEFGRMGPYRSGTTLVDPKGTSVWLSTDAYDVRYGWKRDPGWRLGECIWAQHGIWDPTSDSMLKKDYFAKHPHSGELLTYEVFTNIYFMDFFRRKRDAIREIHRDSILLCQPPVLELPPSIKGTADDEPRLVYAPHFYEAITLMTKTWNPYWNVDVFGILRGRYLSPIFAIKLGETAIRNCIRDQLAAIRQEGLDYMGDHPCVLTEFGIPFDMDEKSAYGTGDYRSQCAAMDANYYAVEGSKINGSTLWLYMSKNNHQWGDQWNGEDLSIFSVDDRVLPLASASSSISLANDSSQTLTNTDSTAKASGSPVEPVSPSNLKQTLSKPSMASEPSSEDADMKSLLGLRASEAFVRPFPIAIAGDLKDYGFDLRGCVFTMFITAAAATSKGAPTEVFLPGYHFPRDHTQVESSGGQWIITTDDRGSASKQILKWWHGEGDQTLKVRGVARNYGIPVAGDDEGYLNHYWQAGCSIM
ncbi:MAG: hypothetical protein M1815_002690 [Lichina confinis]|nr:MAG: hypothetical protein M1815_002690 [Lichina confinis]